MVKGENTLFTKEFTPGCSISVKGQQGDVAVNKKNFSFT